MLARPQTPPCNTRTAMPLPAVASPSVEIFSSPSTATDSNSDVGTSPKRLGRDALSRDCGSPRVGQHAHTPIQVKRRSKKKAKDVHTFFTFKDGNSSCLFCEYVFPRFFLFWLSCLYIILGKNTHHRRATPVQLTAQRQALLCFENTFVTVIQMPG